MPRREDWPFQWLCSDHFFWQTSQKNAVQEDNSSSNEVEDSLVSYYSCGDLLIVFCKLEQEKGEESRYLSHAERRTTRYPVVSLTSSSLTCSVDSLTLSSVSLTNWDDSLTSTLIIISTWDHVETNKLSSEKRWKCLSKRYEKVYYSLAKKASCRFDTHVKSFRYV